MSWFTAPDSSIVNTASAPSFTVPAPLTETRSAPSLSGIVVLAVVVAPRATLPFRVVGPDNATDRVSSASDRSSSTTATVMTPVATPAGMVRTPLDSSTSSLTAPSTSTR